MIAVLGIALAGGAIVMAATRSGGERSFALGAWVAVCVSAGFLLFFVGLAYNDYRSYAAYRETSCYVVNFDDRQIAKQEQRKRHVAHIHARICRQLHNARHGDIRMGHAAGQRHQPQLDRPCAAAARTLRGRFDPALLVRPRRPGDGCPDARTGRRLCFAVL